VFVITLVVCAEIRIYEQMALIVRMVKQKKPQTAQTRFKKLPKRPKRPLFIAPNLASYLTGKAYNKDILGTERNRAIRYVHRDFETFKYILRQDLFTQDQKNEFFSAQMIREFLYNFGLYDNENTEAEEQNKLDIAVSCIEVALGYLENRYDETALVTKEINNFKELMRMLIQITESKARDQRGLEFYKLRHRRLVPPLIRPAEKSFIAMCRICWETREDMDKDKAMKQIRHKKHCPHREGHTLEQVIEVFPPKNPKKKQ